jgi:hypothetical protein
MQQYSDNVIGRNGSVIEGATVTVRDADGNIATLYSDDGVTAQSNPMTTDAAGEFAFYAGDGTYTISVTGRRVGSGNSKIVTLISEASVASYAALRAFAGTSKTVNVTGYLASANPSGIAGIFTRDDADTTSADNGGTIIVASNGKRWKRVFDGGYYVRWFGAALNGTRDDYTEWTTAVAALSDGDTLYIDGPFYYTTPIVLTKNLHIVCDGERGYFKPNTPGSDAFTFRPTTIRKVKQKIWMYGAAGSCANGIVIDKTAEGEFDLNAVVGATGHGVKTLGVLSSDIRVSVSTNRAAPTGSGAAMPAKSLYIGASSDAAFPSCNASRFTVYLGGGGQGIEGANASNEGDYTVEGTIEGNTGPAYAFVANRGLVLKNLHVESGISSASSLTDCANFQIGAGVEMIGLTRANTAVSLVNCAAFKVDGYTGSLDIAADCRNGELGTISLASYDSLTNLAPSVHQVTPVNSLSSTTNASGQIGAFTLENVFHNPYVDLYDGATSAPVGFAGTLITYARHTAVAYGGNPTAVSLYCTTTATSILDGAEAVAATPYTVAEDQWVSVMVALYIPVGQPGVIPYLWVQDTGFVALADHITTTAAWVVVRGTVKVPAGKEWKFVPRPYDGAAFVAGEFIIGGLNFVRGAVPPKHLAEGPGRRNAVMSSIGYNPAFAGQRAFVSGTSKWYLSKDKTATSDWIILN